MATPASFLRALFGQVPADDYVESRLLSRERSPRQLFVQVGDLRERGWVPPVPGEGWNVYVGVVPRVRTGGKARDCGAAVAVWVDLDDPNGQPVFPLAPSIVVQTSPGKHQAYWLLRKPCPDLALIESLNRGIASQAGGDANACDRARVLRLPGFPNLKYPDKPMVELVVCVADWRYSTAELLAAWPPVKEPQFRRVRDGLPAEAPPWLPLVFDAVCDHLEATGHRLRPTGGGFLTTCPLHDDREPSLTLHPVRGWRCWGRDGCGQGKLTLLAASLGISVWGE
jgi:hypothetical protein